MGKAELCAWLQCLRHKFDVIHALFGALRFFNICCAVSSK